MGDFEKLNILKNRIRGIKGEVREVVNLKNKLNLNLL